MKKEFKLVIGKEYYFDLSKECKGIFVGYSKDKKRMFFYPTQNKHYLLQTEGEEFSGHVGFFGRTLNFIKV